MPARRDLDRHLEREELLSVYAIVSAEPLLVAEAIHLLRSRVLTQAPDFNRDEFRAGEVPTERVVDAATTLPMMASCRWVLMRDVQRLKAKDQAPLVAYLDKPAKTSVLCLSGSELDQRTKLGQRLASMHALFVLEPPRPSELPAWIDRRARARSLAIEPDASRLLADLLGADLGGLDMALEKLSTYAAGERVTADHVEAAVAPTKIDNVFKLTDAIGARDLLKASLQLRNMLAGGENALLILSMMARQLRQLLLAKELGADRLSPPELASRIGVRPFLIDSLLAQTKRYSAAELCAAIEALARADVRLKSSKLEPGVILDQLLVEVIVAPGATDDVTT
jgi:DNA polymerase III subunit delta